MSSAGCASFAPLKGSLRAQPRAAAVASEVVANHRMVDEVGARLMLVGLLACTPPSNMHWVSTPRWVGKGKLHRIREGGQRRPFRVAGALGLP